MKPDLEVALAAIEALAQGRGPLARHDVRPLLIGIGAARTGATASDLAAAKQRFSALPAGFRGAWEAAVRDELAMACTEHVRSVDPRYLDHPKYDFAYTVEARRALEARLAGAEVTGVHPDESLTAGIRRADSLLEARMAKNQAERPRPARDPGHE